LQTQLISASFGIEFSSIPSEGVQFMTVMTHRAQMSVDTFGYHSINQEHILMRLEEDSARDLVAEPGNFLIVAKDKDSTHIINSTLGAINYFYSIYGNQLWHGPTVLSVLRASKQKWAWNWDALGDVICFEHPVGNATLHPNVFRVPPGTVLRFASGRLDQVTVQPVMPAAAATPERAIDALLHELQLWLDEDLTLSASGGLDSRLILAACLALRRRPRLVVMGSKDSTDRQIVEIIADRFKLEICPVELGPQDYVSYCHDIVSITNGTNAAHHWHTYIYPIKAGLSKHNRFLVGTNGEFARTFFLNFGIVARTIDYLPHMVMPLYWSLRDKATRTFRPEEIVTFTPEFRHLFKSPAKIERCQRFARRCFGRGILERFDNFYLRERIPMKIGNGIAMYNSTTTAIMPLLCHRWVAEVAGLPRRWRLGDNWHRFAIQRLCPELLEIPEAGIAPLTPSRAPPLYWRPGRKDRQHIVPYVALGKWLRTPIVLALLREREHLFDEIMERAVLRRILDEQAAAGTRKDAVSHLLMMALWLEQVHKLGPTA
jgi:hypothetical protein